MGGIRLLFYRSAVAAPGRTRRIFDPALELTPGRRREGAKIWQNLETAKTLRLKIPDKLLATAYEFIELNSMLLRPICRFLSRFPGCEYAPKFDPVADRTTNSAEPPSGKKRAPRGIAPGLGVRSLTRLLSCSKRCRCVVELTCF